MKYAARQFQLVPRRAAVAARRRSVQQIKHRNNGADGDFFLNPVGMIKRQLPAASLSAAGTEAATAHSSATGTAAAANSWVTTATASTTCTGPAALRLWTDAARGVEAPADALRLFAVKVDRALVDADQPPACIADDATGKGGLDLWCQQRE